MKYIIDLSPAADAQHLHDILSYTLDLPPYYGRNLDALWDCLTSDLAVPCEIHLIVAQNTDFPLIGAMCDLFSRAQAWHTRRGHDVALFIRSK